MPSKFHAVLYAVKDALTAEHYACIRHPAAGTNESPYESPTNRPTERPRSADLQVRGTIPQRIAHESPYGAFKERGPPGPRNNPVMRHCATSPLHTADLEVRSPCFSSPMNPVIQTTTNHPRGVRDTP